MTCPVLRIHILTEGDLHPAVIAVRHAAEAAGFSQNRQLVVATCASELATNILKYAGRGWMKTAPLEDGDGLQLTAEDRGPGIADVELALQDHFSSSGSLGLGLPAVRRMADEFEIVSAPNRGTKLLARFYPEDQSRLVRRARQRKSVSTQSQRPRRFVETASHCRAMQGETRCGDRALVKREKDIFVLAVVDGLGHGEAAAAAAEIAARALERGVDCAGSPVDMLSQVDSALREGRATVAMGIVRVDATRGEARMAGVGNILMARFARLPGAGDLRTPCGEGILGRQWRSPRERRLQLADMDLLLLASDGLPARLSPSDLPALRYGTPAVLATLTVERFGSFQDDCCCLLGRWHP
jgi:anti-sigma regulatory factor (Ser/Thr protein kinase)